MDIRCNFFCHFNEWNDEEIKKEKSGVIATEKTNGENGMKKMLNNSKIQVKIYGACYILPMMYDTTTLQKLKANETLMHQLQHET